jgi:hypothetical protein
MSGELPVIYLARHGETVWHRCRDSDRALAFANIEKAAGYYGVNLSETSWNDLGVHPQRNRKEAAAKGVATREREREIKELSDTAD